MSPCVLLTFSLEVWAQLMIRLFRAPSVSPSPGLKKLVFVIARLVTGRRASGRLSPGSRCHGGGTSDGRALFIVLGVAQSLRAIAIRAGTKSGSSNLSGQSCEIIRLLTRTLGHLRSWRLREGGVSGRGIS